MRRLLLAAIFPAILFLLLPCLVAIAHAAGGLSLPRIDGAKPLNVVFILADDHRYEYYWEYNFPQTPSIFALRGQRYKFIQYHGIWDIDELYDLQQDPLERHNLTWLSGVRRRNRVRTHQLLTEATMQQMRYRCLGADRGLAVWLVVMHWCVLRFRHQHLEYRCHRPTPLQR